MPVSPSHSVLPAPLQRLCASIAQAERNAAHALLQELSARVAEADQALAGLPPALREGSPDGYARHVAYADPHGRFTIVYLVWRPGQHSPVHGHKTWCTYRVLQGELTESHYLWDAAARRARACGGAVRRPGDIVTAAPGLEQIHRLGNAGTQTAISLHIYGVAEADIACGVNHVVAGDA